MHSLHCHVIRPAVGDMNATGRQKSKENNKNNKLLLEAALRYSESIHHRNPTHHDHHHHDLRFNRNSNGNSNTSSGTNNRSSHGNCRSAARVTCSAPTVLPDSVLTTTALVVWAWQTQA